MRTSSCFALLVLLITVLVSFPSPSSCGQLFYSTDTDEGSAIFSIDTASPGNGPVWVRNTSEPIRQFAVDGPTSTLYYVARGITYATGLAPDSAEAVLFSYHDVRALRLVHENASPVLYLTGCDDDYDDDGEQQTQARFLASKRDSCDGVLLWRLEPGSGQPCVVASQPAVALDLVWDLDVQPGAAASDSTAYVVGRRLVRDNDQSIIDVLAPVWTQVGLACGQGVAPDFPALNVSANRGWVAAVGDHAYGLFIEDDSSGTGTTTTLMRLWDDGVEPLYETTTEPKSYSAVTKDETTSTLYFVLDDAIFAALVNGSQVQPQPLVDGVEDITAVAVASFPANEAQKLGSPTTPSSAATLSRWL